ncbi:hypothetical protein FJB73_11810 [Salmonella enterica subsp. enterica]|nr:hypothetical protein [Salmonella enterica]EBG6829874.1 hypothetical protein [Salmonella enterica subsp. enterica]
MLYVVLEYCCLKAAIQRCYLKAIIISWYHIVYVMIGIVLQLLLIISRSAFFWPLIDESIHFICSFSERYEKS